MENKVLIIIKGNESEEDILKMLYDRVLGRIGVGQLVLPAKETATNALIDALECIRINSKGRETPIITVYSGTNLYLLKTNLPCDCVDLSLLKSKLMEVFGGYDTPQQKEMVTDMIIGGILELLA